MDTVIRGCAGPIASLYYKSVKVSRTDGHADDGSGICSVCGTQTRSEVTVGASRAVDVARKTKLKIKMQVSKKKTTTKVGELLARHAAKPHRVKNKQKNTKK